MTSGKLVYPASTCFGLQSRRTQLEARSPITDFIARILEHRGPLILELLALRAYRCLFVERGKLTACT